MALQLDAAHGWHADIRNDARHVVQAAGLEELLRRRKRIDGISVRPDEAARRCADGGVIIDDCNGGAFGQRTILARADHGASPLTRCRTLENHRKSYVGLGALRLVATKA